jgi:hypothetical protein
MLRFRVNRSWGFVLTLCLFTTCFFLVTAQLPSVASAASGGFSRPADDQTPGSSLGDPDVPMGPGDGKAGNLSVVRNGSSQVVSQNGIRPVSDGAVPASSVVMNRLQLFLLGLRSLYLRF